MNNNITKTKKILFILSCVLVLVCVALFLFVAIRYSIKGKFGIDNSLIEFSQDIQNKHLTNSLKLLTHLGSSVTIIILTVILAIVVRPLLLKIFLVVNVGFSGAFCLVVKKIVERPRPVGINLIAETGYSFPSAHSMISVVFYGFLIFIIWKLIKNKTLNIVLTSLLSILTATICYSRVYLGVHFATDVFAGFVAGVAYIVAAIWVYLILDKHIKMKKDDGFKDNVNKIIEDTMQSEEQDIKDVVFDIVVKINNLSRRTTTTIAKLINYNGEPFVEPLTQGSVAHFVDNICKKLSIKLEYNHDSIGGLAYHNKFTKL